MVSLNNQVHKKSTTCNKLDIADTVHRSNSEMCANYLALEKTHEDSDSEFPIGIAAQSNILHMLLLIMGANCSSKHWISLSQNANCLFWIIPQMHSKQSQMHSSL